MKERGRNLRKAGEVREDRGPVDPRRPPRAEQYRGEVVFGVEPIRELITANPSAIRTLFIDQREARRFAAELERVRAAGGQVTQLDNQGLARMAGSQARHQGLVALIREYEYAPLKAVLAAAPDPLLLIDGVTDPRNLGAILRSAEGAGASSVIVAQDRTVGITPVAIKASAGAWAHLRIARCGNVARMLETLKQAGYWVVALAPAGSTSLYELDTNRRLVIVIGAEDRGVREIVKKHADFLVSIPMRGRVSSLNVSVATAVALFEINRRRTAGQPA